MKQHHTAFSKNKKRKRAEETGGEPTGLAPFFSFIDQYTHHFHVRTRPSFRKRSHQYLSGLMQRDSRRNIERIDETAKGSEYQSLHHFLSHSPWDDDAVCAQISQEANELLGGHRDSCLIIDPSGIPKKGKHSVGVARQYCGNVGKVDNCQIGVFAALAKGRDACLIDKRLYLPKQWTQDEERCEKAGIPESERIYKKRAQQALELLESADRNSVDYAWVGMDAEFGVPWLLHELDQRRKTFLIDVKTSHHIYEANPRLKYRSKSTREGRLCLKKKPRKVQAIRLAQGRKGWKKVAIRDSTKGVMQAEYLHKKVWFWDSKGTDEPKCWHLLIRRIRRRNRKQWQFKYSLSNAPLRITTERLAYMQAQRFWVEQAIRDCKDGLGMDEYQVRKWRAWHHHTSLTMLTGLYILKVKLENRDNLPLLSVTDVREMLQFFLPLKAVTLEDLMAQIRERHRLRLKSYRHSRSSQKDPPSHVSRHWDGSK